MTAKNVNPKIKPTKKNTPTYAAPAKPDAPKLAAFTKHLPLVLVAVLFLLLSLLYFPIAYQNQAPQATDITQWEGAAKTIIDYNETHGDNALWTPMMFSGMPSYMISFPNRYPFLESLSRLTDKVINWRIFLLFIGGLGVFLLIRQQKLSPWLAFYAALAFMFSCHWLGLVEIGHNTKYRAIMYIPWVVWALFRLFEKPSLLNLGLMASFLITQLRENHPQISYYLYLFVGMFWVYQLITSLQEKQGKRLIMATVLLAAAFGLTALAVMNPYLSNLEYSHYTMRGGAAGLEKSYGQAWSFPPLEVFSFIIPDLFGGINQSYWGYMPFTQIYNYFGIVVLALGVLALFGKHRKLSIFLWISSFIFTLLSFGSYTPALSDFFLKVLPMFNKFRVPSMILTMVQFNAVLLAALGLDGLIAKAGDHKWQKNLFRAFWISGGVFVLFLLLGRSVFGSLPFTTEAETARLQANNALSQLEQIKDLRLGMLYKSGIISLLFLTISLGLAYLFSAKKLKETALIVLLCLITFIDLYIYTGKYLKDLYPLSERTARFEMQDFDQFLLEDKENYRIYPFNMGQIRPAGEWAYYHQSVDGYSAAKLKRYDDVLKLLQGGANGDGELIRYLKGVYEGGGKETPTPVLDMLNTKYFIYPDSLPYASMLNQIRPVFGSYTGAHIYQNLKALPRAWFVDSLLVIPDAAKRLQKMADPHFEPRRTAIVESQIDGISRPDSAYAQQTKAELHSLSYDVLSDKDAFLVLSEVYYPAGWKAFLNGKETEIFPVNHVLRGIKIPKGKHSLELKFAPASYQRSLIFSLSGLLLALLALLGGLVWEYKGKLLRKSE